MDVNQVQIMSDSAAETPSAPAAPAPAPEVVAPAPAATPEAPGAQREAAPPPAAEVREEVMELVQAPEVVQEAPAPDKLVLNEPEPEAKKADAPDLVAELKALKEELAALKAAPKAPEAAPAPAPVEPRIEAEDLVTELLTNPESALEKALAKIESRKAEQAAARKAAVEAANAALKAIVKDADDVAKAPEFKEWVKASPVRARLYEESGRTLDVATRAELLTLFKETRGAASASPAADDAASVAMASAGEATNAPTVSKPIFNQAKLVELRAFDPEKYEQLLPQIKQAYLEGRVR